MSTQTQVITATQSARERSTAELFPVGVVLALLLMALWTPLGMLNTATVLATALTILWFTLSSGNSARQLGLAEPASGAVSILSAGILAVLLVAGAGVLMRVFGPAHPVPWNRAWQYAVWAVVQEFILQSFFYTNLERVLGPRPAVVWAASLFALVHLPSAILTVLTFVGGLLFCELFRRYRNVYALGLVHGAVGLTIAATMPDSILHHMRVGIGYLLYHS